MSIDRSAAVRAPRLTPVRLSPVIFARASGRHFNLLARFEWRVRQGAGTFGMWNYFWIAIGSALGGSARYWLSGFVADRIGETFPWGTIIINVTGSLVIGFFATLTGPDGRLLVGSTTRQFVMVGFCGGYTTFSSFSLQTLTLARDGEWLWAAGNIGFSVLLCLLAVWVGHAAAAMLNGA